MWQFDPLKDHPWPTARLGGRQPGLCLVERRQAGRRASHHSRHVATVGSSRWTREPASSIEAFGEGGIRDLRAEFPDDVKELSYGPTSAPAIWQDTIIIGVSNGEGPGIAAPGDIRAFDVRTGAQVWSFHTVPQPGEFGNDTWEGDSWKNRGGANAWGGVSVDEQRGLVFCGTGSAAFDFYGGDRHGDNLFANCTLCLDAATGERKWHFQTLHHDLWDHDTPAYPNLVTVTRDGESVDAVAQVTKTGYVFVFDRETGRAVVRDRGEAVSEVRRSRRAGLADAAGACHAAADRRSAPGRNQRDQHRRGQSKVGARTTQEDS